MNVTLVALGVYRHEGGIERFNRRVLACLGSSSHRAHAISLWDREEEAPRKPADVVFSPCDSRKLRALVAFARSLRRDRPDVVVYGHVLLAPLAVAARLLRRRAVNVLIVHGYEVWDRPGRVRRWLVSSVIDRIASVSDFTAVTMAGAYGLERSRFLRVINAADHVGHLPSRAPGGGDTLLVVSRLNPLNKAKNVDKVIAAMPRILEEVPSARLYVVGDGTWRPELETLARSLGVDEHVQFLGAVTDDRREELYAQSDVFVLPSTQEGFGIVYLEAWRHALPVIAGAGGAGPEVVRDGLEGVVVEPEPDAVAKAAVRLLRDPALRERLGTAGYRRLASAFTPSHFDAALLGMLDAATAG